MLRNSIPRVKICAIRRLFIEGLLNPHQMALKLGLSYNTVYSWVNEFKIIQSLYPAKLADMRFFLKRDYGQMRRYGAYDELIAALPELIATDPHKRLTAANLFRKYQLKYDCNYSESQFNNIYVQWKKANNINEFHNSKVNYIHEKDLQILNAWRKSAEHRNWQKAVAILESFNGRCLREVAEKIEANLDTVEQWVAIFKLRGIAGLLRKAWTLSDTKVKEVQQKMSNLNALIHQTPSLYGINRTSWRTEDLAAVYQQVYGVVLTKSTVWNYLQRQGFRFRKAREILTSPDPNFREKLDKITSILNNLTPEERFFSIDEMGPCGVRAKTGWSYTAPGEQKHVNAHQQAKGYIICTAALELTTNQITHFYSPGKNTDEMIRLMEILLQQYRGMETLYLSWDAASWHASAKLKERIREVSTASYRTQHGTPAVKLAPLPASAQFLNVIESVFSGLAKAVLHNSDYNHVEECKQAIDRYFDQRNAYYLKHPKRAGNRIWGKELVPAKFSPDQNCKDPRVRFTTKKKSPTLKKRERS